MSLLLDVANGFKNEPDYHDYILDEPVLLGVDKFKDASVTIKFIMKTEPDKMWLARRGLLRRIKNRFDEGGIDVTKPLIKVKSAEW